MQTAVEEIAANRAIVMATELLATQQGVSHDENIELGVEGGPMEQEVPAPWRPIDHYATFIQKQTEAIINSSVMFEQLEAGGGVKARNPPRRTAATEVDLTHLTLNTDTVEPDWFADAATEGICVLDLCANVSTMLVAVLEAGWKVKKYIYVDNCAKAESVAQLTVARLQRRYPGQLTASACRSSFSAEKDITKWTQQMIQDLMRGLEREPWLVGCGWPCKDNSPAGKQRAEQGERSILIKTAVLPMVRWMQQTGPRVAYILENVAIQYNWKHKNMWMQLLSQYDTMMGTHVCFDAVKVG